MTVDAPSTWNVTASSTVSQALSNAGTVAFVAPTGGTLVPRTLTVGRCVGTPGSVIQLHTALGGDSSPSDKLMWLSLNIPLGQGGH